jgi:hypothetical protein
MTGKIFSLTPDNQLRPLNRAGFSTEDLFQKLLADHPAVLGTVAGDLPLLLIGREKGVADGEYSSRWSLDHLYVDHDGVPILVEVKRAQDTRTRREVIAQMLDYAANAVAYWSLKEIIDAFEAGCRVRALDAERTLADFLGDGRNAEQFWRSVEANLSAGRIRMVFVADEIPKELKRIVEFLNEQMRPAEVLAIQIEQYAASDGSRTLVPKVIGETERATAVKSVTDSGPRLTIEEWLAALEQDHGHDTLRGTKRALAWFAEQGAEIAVSRSQDSISIKLETDDGKRAWPFFIRSNGRLETALGYLQNRPAYASESARKALLEQLLQARQLEVVSRGSIAGFPTFAVARLADNAAWGEFRQIAEQVLQAARR